ncbi:MAG: hypothetical protein IJ524_07270 [Bacteroidales bacterium]|nr:hypothetical protein [Bacteroidales bacterium]
MVIVLIINLFTTRIVLQALGVVDYGVYNVVCGFVAMFGFLNTSMSNGIQRFFNFEYGKNGEEGANKVYCTSLYIQFALTVVIVLLVEPIGVWCLNHKMVIPPDRLVAAQWIFQFSVLSFVVGIMQAPFSAAVTAHERMGFYAIVSVLDAVLKFAIAFLITVVAEDKLIVYGLLMALISVVNIVVYYIYCKRNFKEIRLKKGLNKYLFKSMLGFSGWNLFGSFSGVMANQGIDLVLNFFFGPIVNAARGVANQVNGAVQAFVLNISMAVRPQVTQSYAIGDINRTMSLTYSVSKITCAIVLVLAIPASLEINFLLQLWLGNNVPEHTAFFTIIILLTSLITNLNWATSGVVHATGIMRNYQVSGSLIRMLSVPIAFVILKYYKIPELALLSVLLCQMVAHAVGLFVVRGLVEMSIRDYCSKVVIPIFMIMILSSGLTWCLHSFMCEGFFRLIVVSIFNLILVSSLFYFFGFNLSEKEMVNSILRKVFSIRNKT